jgi:hypothetical protein
MTLVDVICPRESNRSQPLEVTEPAQLGEEHLGVRILGLGHVGDCVDNVYKGGPVHLPRLRRLGSERRNEHTDGTSDESSPVHYWIISSARTSTAGGIVRPRALAVLRLMTSSNLVGCSTGKSAGFAPLRILST